MSNHVAVVRDGDGLRSAYATVSDIEAAADQDPSLANTALAARFITGAALLRQESRGAHARRDFPEERLEFQQRSFLTLDDLNRLSQEMLGAEHAASAVGVDQCA